MTVIWQSDLLGLMVIIIIHIFYIVIVIVIVVGAVSRIMENFFFCFLYTAKLISFLLLNILTCDQFQ